MEPTLTIGKELTLNANATYQFGLKTTNAKADKVVIKGVTIGSGALFSFTEVGTGALTPGTVFTAVDNTVATRTPIVALSMTPLSPPATTPTKLITRAAMATISR